MNGTRFGNGALIFAEDPGGANFVRHLPELLQEIGCPARVFAAGSALQFLQERDNLVVPLVAGSEQQLIESNRPRVVIVSTSVNADSPGLMLIEAARRLDIPTIGVVDAVMSAKLRFRGQTQDPLHYAPDWLMVPDEATANGYYEIGFPRDQVIVTVQLQHYHAWLRGRALEEEDRARLRVRVLPSDALERQVLVFIAEPPVPPENGYVADEEMRGWGDTDDRTHVALQELLDVLTRNNLAPYLILRLHDRNDPSLFERYADHLSHVSKGGDPLELVFVADLVVGQTSSLVVEAAVMGRPAISIRVTQRERGLLPSSVSDHIVSVYSRAELEQALVQGICDRSLKNARPGCFQQEAHDALVRSLYFILDRGNKCHASLS